MKTYEAGSEMDRLLAPFRGHPDYVIEEGEREGRPSVFIIHKETLKRLALDVPPGWGTNHDIWHKV